jgi:uncharacterized protein
MDLPAIARAVLDQYRLGPGGLHGVAHWARVLENGRLLAEETGAHPAVIALFSLLHDSCRRSDGSDPGHGTRGAEFAASLRGVLFDLPDEEFDLLYVACALHSDGRTDVVQGSPANGRAEGGRGKELRDAPTGGIRRTRARGTVDLTIQTCWDADRLDLGRVGIVVRPARLCTAAARDAKLIAWARRRGYEGFIPPLVRDEWRLDPMDFEPGRI